MFAVCLRAKHDPNGNPRRVWLIYANEHECTPRYTVSEGYGGRSGVADRVIVADEAGPMVMPGRTRLRSIIDCAPVFDVTPAQYREYAKRKDTIYA